MFKCDKCAQYIYVNTKQKTKKCLRCGCTHQVKNIREKKIESETVLGLTTAVNKIKELQNTFAIQELGKTPDLRTEKDFHVFKKSKTPEMPRINKKNELKKSEIINKALQKLFKSYMQVLYYLKPSSILSFDDHHMKEP